VIDSKGHSFGCFGLAKAETGAKKEKAGVSSRLLSAVICGDSIHESRKESRTKLSSASIFSFAAIGPSAGVPNFSVSDSFRKIIEVWCGT